MTSGTSEIRTAFTLPSPPALSAPEAQSTPARIGVKDHRDGNMGTTSPANGLSGVKHGDRSAMKDREARVEGRTVREPDRPGTRLLDLSPAFRRSRSRRAAYVDPTRDV